MDTQPTFPFPTTSKLVRVYRVAKYLDVSKKRVYQMVQEGKLAAVRLGPRSMRIPTDSINAFIESGRKRNQRELGNDLPPMLRRPRASSKRTFERLHTKTN